MTWRTTFAALAMAALALTSGPAYASSGWDETVSKARGQTVYWNAWGGDERTNSFIDWVGQEVQARYGIAVRQVKLSDTAEAVSRVIAEKTAGRDTDGSVDLIWINGPNFLSLKEKKLLYGPFTQLLPNYRYVDMTDKQSNVTDFTIPVDGMASPWRLAQFAFNYDSSRVKEMPRTIPDFLPWAKAHPGRFTHPDVRDFMGATFLKQALIELAPDRNRLQQPARGRNKSSPKSCAAFINQRQQYPCYPWLFMRFFGLDPEDRECVKRCLQRFPTFGPLKK